MRHYKKKFQDIAMQNFYEWMRDLGYKMSGQRSVPRSGTRSVPRSVTRSGQRSGTR